MATSYAPLTPGANEFGNVGGYFGAVADNRAAGRSRILEQESFETKLLDAVKEARLKSEAEQARSRATSAGGAQVDIAKLMYESQKDQRDFSQTQARDAPDIAIKQNKLNSQSTIGQVLMGNDTAAKLNAFAGLGVEDLGALYGLANLERGAGDNEISRARAAIDGNYIGDSSSVSVEGQNIKAREDLTTEMILKELDAKLNPNGGAAPPVADLSVQESAIDNILLGIEPGASKDRLAELRSYLTPEQVAAAQAAGAQAQRQTKDEMIIRDAMARSIGGGAMPVYSNDWFAPPSIGPSLNIAAAQAAAPPPQAIQALTANPTNEAILAFIAQYGEEAYAQIAGG